MSSKFKLQSCGNARKSSIFRDNQFISHYISSVVVGFGPGKGEYSKGEWDKKYDFWLYIQGELKRHGTDSRLIFRTGYAGTNNPGIAYDIEDVDMFRYQYGELAWLPLTFFDDNLKYICL